ncbi:MAG: ABC transporter permease [Desulfovibrio sp.]|uniref:ABC transporter permease n=1 Tax=Desulfovibrio sp. 7SRBS1 TaxID=3378064 RepID=UPI003B3FC96F
MQHHKAEMVVGIVLVVAMGIIGLINPAFWQFQNMFSLLQSNVVMGIMALGVLLVLISGGIDVSFPAFAVAAMYLTVKYMVATGSQGIFIPFLMATAMGMCLGFMNGFFVYRFKIIPLIVTLGTASLVRGLLLGGVGTSMININKMPKVLINFATTELWGFTTPDGTHYGLTAMILVYIGLALMVHLILRYTLMGRSVYAMGGDQVSAQRIGFSLRKTTFFVYGLAGALAGFAGLLHSSMIWLANPRDFGGLELDVIAAVVLGGASIFGGKGSVLGTMLGVFTLVMVKNSLIIMHVDTTWQRVVVGMIILAATAATAYRDRNKSM